MSEAMKNKEVLEQNIVGENGIHYTLGADGMYYPELELPEGTHYDIGKYGWNIWQNIVDKNISNC